MLYVYGQASSDGVVFVFWNALDVTKILRYADQNQNFIATRQENARA